MPGVLRGTIRSWVAVTQRRLHSGGAGPPTVALVCLGSQVSHETSILGETKVGSLTVRLLDEDSNPISGKRVVCHFPEIIAGTHTDDPPTTRCSGVRRCSRLYGQSVCEREDAGR